MANQHLRWWLFCVLVPLSGCYSLQQAFHFNNTYNGRRPVAEVVAEDKTPSATKEKLAHLKRIMAFAREAGLNTDGAYEYYIDIGKRPVSYTVQAAEADALIFKKWWFLFVGDVPYLGFFSQQDRDAEADRLAAAGYDVAVSSVGAFSSLGFFDDPIYSSMLRRNEANLAQLFFHELTHRTFWSVGSPTFNENLAEYIGLQLTQSYLTTYNKKNLLEEFIIERGERALFKDWLKQLRAALETLYKAGVKGGDKKDLMTAKAEIFATYTGEKFPAFTTEAFRRLRGKQWNNASVLAASLYSPDTERFEAAHRCFGNERKVGDFLMALREAEDKTGDAFKALDYLCNSK